VAPLIVYMSALAKNGHPPGEMQGGKEGSGTDMDIDSRGNPGHLEGGIAAAFLEELPSDHPLLTPTAGQDRRRKNQTARVSSAGFWFLVVAVVAAALIAVELLYPVAYQAPTLQVAVETTTALFALAGAWLVWHVFVYTRRLRAWLLFLALVGLTMIVSFGYAVPAALDDRSASGATAFLPLAWLMVASAMAFAAATPANRLVTGGRRPFAIALLISASALGIAELCGLLLRDELCGRSNYSGPWLTVAVHHPLGLAVLLGGAALLVFSSVRLGFRAALEESRGLWLLAFGALLLAASRADGLALPWVSPEAMTPGEGIRLAAVALLLGATVYREFEIRAAMTRSAAITERRRVAQDLHDGIAQDLALIAAHAPRLRDVVGGDHPLAIAAQRALAVSRTTISFLSDAHETSSADALRATGHELGERLGITVAVDIQPKLQLPADVWDNVMRIAREAIANAARHGGAQIVIVSLEHRDTDISLRIRDDGRGMFHGQERAAPAGFGLRSMEDRAATLGGYLKVAPRRGGGTELEILFPGCVDSAC
jgi:signal transduction histidine kinase